MPNNTDETEFGHQRSPGHIHGLQLFPLWPQGVIKVLMQALATSHNQVLIITYFSARLHIKKSFTKTFTLCSKYISYLVPMRIYTKIFGTWQDDFGALLLCYISANAVAYTYIYKTKENDPK